MEAHDRIQLRRQWILEDLVSSPPWSPPRSLIEMNNDHWISPLPITDEDQESGLRYDAGGPEMARIIEKFAETYAKISKALFEAEQRRWDAICKRRSKVQNELMLTEDKNQLDLEALPPVAISQSAPTTAALMPLDVDNTKEECEHSKDREASGIHEERLLGRKLEQEDAAVGKKRKITRHGHRDISEIVAEVMEAKKAMENVGYNMS